MMMGFRHELLIEALRAHDPVMARQAMIDELDRMRTFTLERVTQKESAFWQLGTRD
jgi:DNA-binding GntR family transcriptional regulator